jgi:hypothetical protein
MLFNVRRLLSWFFVISYAFLLYKFAKDPQILAGYRVFPLPGFGLQFAAFKPPFKCSKFSLVDPLAVRYQGPRGVKDKKPKYWKIVQNIQEY